MAKRRAQQPEIRREVYYPGIEAICAYRRCRKTFKKKRSWQKYCCGSHKTQEYKARVRDREAERIAGVVERTVRQELARIERERGDGG